MHSFVWGHARQLEMIRQASKRIAGLGLCSWVCLQRLDPQPGWGLGDKQRTKVVSSPLARLCPRAPPLTQLASFFLLDWFTAWDPCQGKAQSCG